jgi:hypothetical protein
MKRIFAALVVPILVISLGSLGVSHFTQNAAVRYGLHPAYVDVGFIAYEYMSAESYSLDIPNDHTVQVSTNVSAGWSCWIGFILQNFGTTYSASVNTPTYDVISNGLSMSSYFIHTEYFYRPWNASSIPYDVYGGVVDHLVSPPPPGNVLPPVNLQPTKGSDSVNTMVLWIFVQYPSDASGLINPIQLAITISATPPPAITTSSQTWP